MKRLICLILSVIILSSNAIPASVSATNDSANQNHVLGLQAYLDTDNDEYLLRNENYAYWGLIEDFESDIVKWELLNTIDSLIHCGTEPDVQKYTEVLVNIIATYDRDNATAISEQHKNDNKKSALDYAMDISKIGADAVGLMVSTDKSAGDLEKWISIAVSGLSTLAGNVDNWIDALSDLETLVQNYGHYDTFLALIQEESSGDLKIAASNLRTSMAKAMQIKLDSYTNILDENFEQYGEFFFSDVFFDALKLTSEYDSDENLKFFIDCGSKFADNINEYFINQKKAWDLGIAIGTLVGNIAVGGEDIINRLHELMALRDIGDILCEELSRIGSNYDTGEYDSIIAEKYFTLSHYLIGCRIRGEYCRYSIVASDSGLRSKFSFKNAEEAAKWYEEKCAKILAIQNSIKTACNAILVHVETSGYEVGELSEWYIYDESGSLCSNYTLRITSKEKMHIGAIIADDFTQPLEYVITTSDPLLLELDPGYWYGFEIVDNANTENILLFTVSVNQSSEGLIDMIEIHTDFCAAIQSETDPLESFIQNCDSRYFSVADISNFDENDCLYARNAIFAKSGWIFSNQELSNYFQKYSWYNPTVTADEFTDAMLNQYQIANRDLIIAFESGIEAPSANNTVYSNEDDNLLIIDRFTSWYRLGTDEYCYHIPMISLNGHYDYLINDRIYNQFYPLWENRVEQHYKEYGYPELSEIVYSLGQKDDLLSIVFQTSATMWDESSFYVYTISTETGEEVPFSELYRCYGLTESGFFDLVMSTMQKYWDKQIIDLAPNIDAGLLQGVIDKTLSADNVRTAIPYINKNGELCFVGRIYWIAGADYYHHLLNTSGYVDEGWIECTTDHSAN